MLRILVKSGHHSNSEVLTFQRSHHQATPAFRGTSLWLPAPCVCDRQLQGAQRNQCRIGIGHEQVTVLAILTSRLNGSFQMKLPVCPILSMRFNKVAQTWLCTIAVIFRSEPAAQSLPAQCCTPQFQGRSRRSQDHPSDQCSLCTADEFLDQLEGGVTASDVVTTDCFGSPPWSPFRELLGFLLQV